MALLVGFGIGLAIVLIAVLLLMPDVKDDVLGCEDDIPCQECGRCYGDHINGLGISHSYRYPRDLHR